MVNVPVHYGYPVQPNNVTEVGSSHSYIIVQTKSHDLVGAGVMARLRRFAQVDGFTDSALYGNPVAVVLDGAGIDERRARDLLVDREAQLYAALDDRRAAERSRDEVLVADELARPARVGRVGVAVADVGRGRIADATGERDGALEPFGCHGEDPWPELVLRVAAGVDVEIKL